MTPMPTPGRLVGRLGRQFGTAATGTATDVVETDETVLVAMEAPGFDAAAFDVTLLDERRLRVRTERGPESDAAGRYVRRERRRRPIDRTVRLPAPVDGEGATASYDAGVLTVRLPVDSDADGDRTAFSVVPGP